MVTRRDLLQYTATGAALALAPGLPSARLDTELMTRRVPSTGEALPVVGLGSSATFRSAAGRESADVGALRNVLSTFVENGGRVFDTAPGYGASEEVAARIVNELGFAERVFWATKVNVAPRGGGPADPGRARAQIQASFERIGKTPIDCIQVHNLGDPPTQLGILKELKAEGRVRYIGATCTTDRRYPELEQLMRDESLDFIGVDYAVDNREAASRILPLAEDLGVGVLVYAPFGRTRLWRRVAGRPLPDWAREFDAASWAQFFIKFVLAQPAVTAVTPSTSKPANMMDNLGGGIGGLPDASMLQRMVTLVDSLPSA